MCRELLGYDLSKEDELKIIKEENLFRTFYPAIVRSAAEWEEKNNGLDEIIKFYVKVLHFILESV